ncbi:MAG: RedB protein [Chthoniobacterales bacterium]
MKKLQPLFLALLWLAAVGCGTGILLVYDYTPGEAEGGIPKSWAASSRIPHSANLPTLIMFAHPQCPCTRASIGELAVLMAQCQGKVNAYVAFFQPKGSGADWTHTDLWRSAAAIPGVTVLADEDGREAADFEATTSGHVVLYDAGGRLLFSGGITESRGHSGDNEGRSAIVEVLKHGGPSGHTTPTFGCSLLNPTIKDVAMQLPWTP